LLKVLEELTSDHMQMCKEKEKCEMSIDKLTSELESTKTMHNDLNDKHMDLKNELDKHKLEIQELKAEMKKLELTRTSADGSRTSASRTESNLRTAHTSAACCSTSANCLPTNFPPRKPGLGYVQSFKSVPYQYNNYHRRWKDKYGFLQSDQLCTMCGRLGHHRYQCYNQFTPMFKKPIYPTVRQHRQIYVPKKKGPKQIWVPKVNM